MVYKNRADSVQLHISVYRERFNLEKIFIPKIGEEVFNSFFKDYEYLGTKPTEVFKRATKHKIAAEVLKKCIENFKESEFFKAHEKSQTEDAVTPKKFIYGGGYKNRQAILV